MYIYFSMWFIVAVSILLINIYVVKLFKKIGKYEPEFFERNHCMIMPNMQTMFYMVLYESKKLNNIDLRKKCLLLKRLCYLVGVVFIILVIIF